MNLVESILTKNPCYAAGRKIDVKGLMLHSVGCSQPRAQAFINSWNSESFDRACVHGFIDGNDGTVYQTLPWNHRGWHAGGSANNTHIGVEMCEPACITYTGGSSFECSDYETAKAVASRTYNAAVELFAMLCKEYGLDPTEDGVIISHREGCARGVASNHGDPEHLWNQLGMGYSMDSFRLAVANAMKVKVPEKNSTLQAIEFASLSDEDVIAKVGPLFTENQKESGVLASVSLAQFILESGYGKSELAQNANNCFGMKKSLSGNTWSGSSWDGESIYTKHTQEQNADGSYETITADFRKYPDVAASIADHSAYLLGAKKGSGLRYEGLKGETDYKTAIQIIKDGGYATSLTYVEKICKIIEKWNLTKYDASGCTNPVTSNTVFPVTPFLVKVIIDDLNYRAEPCMGDNVRGQTGIGTFTILEVRDGWGRLKSGAGWIWLENPNYCTIYGSVSEEAPAKFTKTVDELANEVIRGDWGNGAERKERLTAAGYDYATIQHRVNEILS